MISVLLISLAFADPSEPEETSSPPQEEENKETSSEDSKTESNEPSENTTTEPTEDNDTPPSEPPTKDQEIESSTNDTAPTEEDDSTLSPKANSAAIEMLSTTPPPKEKPSTLDSNKPIETDVAFAEPAIDLSNAEELKDLGKKQLMWLKPLPERFEQNPYLHVDFTSYTLEWGEVQVGLNTLKAGILPRTQVGTSLPMWAVGLQNFDAKVNLLRYGAFDLALEGNSISLPTPDFRMSLTGGGLSTSVRILEPWTVHFGTQYMAFTAQGLPDLDRINPFILQMSGVDADKYRDELAADGVGFDINANVVTVRMATDIRLNRRDSWIIQAQGIVWHSIDSTSNFNDSDDIPKFLNADEIFALQSEGASDITKSYVVSVAHQWSWNHSYLRIGAGWSSMSEFAFAPAIIQSIDYAWRFGGKSKNREGKIRKGWKENKEQLEKTPKKDK